MSIKKGDNVVIIAGKDKGKTGKVLEVYPKENRILVDGVNIVTKHKKARTQQEKSGIIKKTAPIDASNAMVVCSSCGKATRVYHKEVNGKKVRVCKCGVSLDKEFVKTTKKEAKKTKADGVAKQEKTTKQTAKTATKKETSANQTKKVEETATKSTSTTKTVKSTEKKVAEKPVEKKTVASKQTKATGTKTTATKSTTSKTQTQKSKTAKKDA